MDYRGVNGNTARISAPDIYRLVSDSIVVIDSWALLLLQDNAVQESRRRQQIFLQQLADACIQTNSPIATSILTWDKLNMLMESGTASEAYAAKYALSFLEFLDQRHLLNTIEKTTAGSGEIESICERLASAANSPSICVITLNGNLNQSLSNLARRMQTSICAYRVNMGGQLSDFAPSVNAISRKSSFSSLSTAPRPIAAAGAATPAEGTVLYGRSKIPYKLGTRLGSGGEADIFCVEDNDNIVIKVYKQFTTEAQEHKVALLSSLKVDGCVLPRDRVYTSEGNFCGYMMERVNGVTLTQTFDPQWRAERERDFLFEQLFSWNRSDFIHAALKLIRIESELMKHGVYMVDSRLDNVMVGYDCDGFLSADHLYLTDLDSAQVNSALLSGSKEHGWITAGGITPDFSAPEVIRALPFTTETLVNNASMAFQLALQAFTIVQTGLHPYEGNSDAADHNLRTALLNGEFSLGLHGTNPTAARRAYLLSYLPGQLKNLFRSTFFRDGQYFAAACRSDLIPELINQLSYADTYFRDANRVKTFPEMLSLAPTGMKPFLHECSSPDCPTPHKKKKLVYSPADLTEGTIIKVGSNFLCRECYARSHPQAVLG